VPGISAPTALIVELDTRIARVAGNGTATVRRNGVSRVLESGTELSLLRLGALLRGEPDPEHEPPARDPSAATATPSYAATSGSATSGSAASASAPTGPATSVGHPLPSLGADADATQARFETCLAARHVEGCVTAMLDLETAIVDWASDTDDNDHTDRARRILRGMVVRLGELAEVGARDPRDVVRPYVELALQLRTRARSAKDFAASDLIRDQLGEAGVEVRDTPDGAAWSLREG